MVTRSPSATASTSSPTSRFGVRWPGRGSAPSPLPARTAMPLPMPQPYEPPGPPGGCLLRHLPRFRTRSSADLDLPRRGPPSDNDRTARHVAGSPSRWVLQGILDVVAQSQRELRGRRNDFGQPDDRNENNQ